jgi:hypothetical protein
MDDSGPTAMEWNVSQAAIDGRRLCRQRHSTIGYFSPMEFERFAAAA